MRSLRRLATRVRVAWQAARLEADVRAGRRTWGRQPGDPALGGGEVGIRVPVEASIEGVVIRADGTREERGVLSARKAAEVDIAILGAMRRRAETERGDDR